MAATNTDLQATTGDDIGFRDLPGQDHRIVQWQSVTQAAKAYVLRALRKRGKYRQRIDVDGEFLKKRMFQRTEHIEAVFIQIGRDIQNVVDNPGMRHPLGALKFGIHTKANILAHECSLLTVFTLSRAQVTLSRARVARSLYVIGAMGHNHPVQPGPGMSVGVRSSNSGG